MNKLIKREEITENDITYVIETYENYVVKYAKPSEIDESQPTHEPTQLDRIEETVNALAADSVTVEKLNAAIAEGVNEV